MTKENRMSNVPSTTDELNYPIEREVAAREAGYVKFEFDPRIFRPRPFKDREKADNKLFFLAFDYNKFKWFRNWPNLRWYYLKLPLHRVNEVTDSGRIRQAQIMCEPSMNRFATEQLSDSNTVVPAPFLDERTGKPIGYCAFCKRSQELWDTYRDQKKAAGIEGLTEARFKEEMDKHPEIKKTSTLAREWGAQDRFYFAVFDYSRWLGETAREADDDGTCTIQTWIGPQTIVEELYKKQKAKWKFWDFASNAARALIVTRDNKKSRVFCEYSVEIENEAPQLDGETTAYLQSPPTEDFNDPAEFVHRMTNSEKKNYVTAYGSGSPTPRNDDGGGTDVAEDPEPDGPHVVAEAPAAEVQSTPAARPRARSIAAPTTPPPTTAASAATATSAPAEAPAPPSQEAPPAPSADASAPKRVKVTWRR